MGAFKTILALLATVFVFVWGLPAEVTSGEEEGLVSMSVGTGMVDNSSGNKPVPQGSSKCSVGCGVGIGVGCLAGVIIIGFIFVMARRHKRKLHLLWQHRKWLATQKELPDKPVPAPPLPTKN
ncbi:hypothetical protein IWW36_002679 [Coemansia brasiliensis]|uniref:Transmembrane protein n=1 Tax=Coemansia brasiliensis TaxID=2650707 RepID=A0A9W8I6N9_9FUNG|nr:hypothetical protein IWW36_002679 [Coemansia brasiliensis]